MPLSTKHVAGLYLALGLGLAGSGAFAGCTAFDASPTSPEEAGTAAPTDAAPSESDAGPTKGDASVMDAETACTEGKPCDGGGCINGQCDPKAMGCSDGTREGYTDFVAFPRIAGCSGAWSVPGLRSPASFVASCSRMSGNNGSNTAGVGCSVADLCQEGWNVCASKSQVLYRNDGGCDGALGAVSTTPDYFFATRQGGINNNCPDEEATGGVNDFYGCGNIGEAIQRNWGTGQTGSNCAPLTRGSGNNCGQLPDNWKCPTENNAGQDEAQVVTKTSNNYGGVLCCRE